MPHPCDITIFVIVINMSFQFVLSCTAFVLHVSELRELVQKKIVAFNRIFSHLEETNYTLRVLLDLGRSYFRSLGN